MSLSKSLADLSQAIDEAGVVMDTLRAKVRAQQATIEHLRQLLELDGARDEAVAQARSLLQRCQWSLSSHAPSARRVRSCLPDDIDAWLAAHREPSV